MIEASKLLLPLMVGSITAATLTFSGGVTLEKYMSEYVENTLKTPLNGLVPSLLLPFNVKKLALVAVSVFLLSEILLVGYIAFDCEKMVYASYVFFFTGVLMLLSIIIYAVVMCRPSMFRPLPLKA